MSLFGRRDNGPRSATDREQARRDREIARARREGRPIPTFEDEIAPPPLDPPAVEHYEPVAEDLPPADLPPADLPPAEAAPADLDWDPYAAEWDQPAPLDAAHDDPTAQDLAASWEAPPAPQPEPEPAAEEPVAEEPAAPAPAPAPGEERPHWDRTDAWDAIPPTQPPASREPRPTLEEELGAVDRGEPAQSWFDEEPTASERLADEPGQETVEWDVLANRPKERPQPPDGPAGADQPTVEWDVTKHLSRDPEQAPSAPRPAAANGNGTAPHEDAAEAEPAIAKGRELEAPDPVEGVGRAVPRGAAAAAGGGAAGAAAAGSAKPSARAAARGRFGDEDARPTPARKGTRARTLPPPPPGPGERKRRTAGRPKRGAIAAVLGLVIVAVLLYFANAVFQPFKGAGSGKVALTIPANSSVGDVADLLAEKGVVESASFFTVRARLDGASLQAGAYELKQDMPYDDAIAVLEAGPVAPPTIKVAIPEGRARREVVPIVDEAGLRGSYLEASERSKDFNPRRYGAPKSAKSLEGFLFPATYELKPNGTSRQLVAQQLDAFRSNISGVSMKRARARNLDTYDVLIIASMIDREATLAKERRTISAVIHNRLKQGMPLGIDATIRYATRNWSKPLKESELAIDSPYNTRRRTGLPPTPIGSPGLASIKAAANPSGSKALFYVVKPCGNGAHNFSSTSEQFEQDVAAYRAKQKELGRSPDKC